jgi:hypothetical protein
MNNTVYVTLINEFGMARLRAMGRERILRPFHILSHRLALFHIPLQYSIYMPVVFTGGI